MLTLLILLIVALGLEAMGVVLLSRGLKQVGEIREIRPPAIVRWVRAAAANRSILLGVALEALFFGVLLYLLSQKDVSLIWPLTSLGFVLTAVAAKFFLQEEISPVRWAGVALIVVGAALVSYSETAKSAPTGNPQVTPSLDSADSRGEP